MLKHACVHDAVGIKDEWLARLGVSAWAECSSRGSRVSCPISQNSDVGKICKSPGMFILGETIFIPSNF